MRRDIRWKVLQWKVLLAAIALLAASCSATDSLLGNETEETIGSGAVAETSGDVEVTSEEAGQAGAGDDEEGVVKPSIWIRADDDSMRPTTPRASMSELIAPGNGRGWTIVGSVFDYDTNTAQPAVWTVDEPGSRVSWTRADINQPDGGSAKMSGVARTEEFDIAVGSHGQERDQRPAVWVQPDGEQWRSVDRSQFDMGAREWLVDVVIKPSNGLVMARGGRTGADGKTTPVLWASSDGEQWEAVKGLPFATDGSEGFSTLASGLTTSILTGHRELGLRETAVAYWSDDGRTWTEADVEIPADSGDSYLGEATWFTDRFVAVGGVATDGIFRPASWVSDDGKVWALQQPPFELNDDGRSTNRGFGASRITSTDTMLYATSRFNFLQHLWQSSDGTNWTPVGNIWDIRPEGVSVSSVAADDNQILLVTGEPGVIFYHDDDYKEAPLGDRLLPAPDEAPWVNDVIHDGDVWVAAGGTSIQTSRGDTTTEAQLWQSENGVDWELAEQLPEALAGPVASITSWSGGLRAVGTQSIRNATARGTVGRGLIWQSSDSDWTELDTPSVREDDARIGLIAVASAGDDLLAGGWRFSGDEGNSDAVLVQGDASATPEQIDIGHRGPDNERVVALCGNESGEAVAVVAVFRPDTAELAALQRSPDREWSDVEWPSLPQGTEGRVSDCAYGADGFLAAGFTSTGEESDVGLWRSTDGSSWERVDGPPSFSAGGDQWVTSMAVTEAGYLLAGNDAANGEVVPVVWHGSGDDWEQIVIDDAASMDRLQIEYADGTIVVAGWKDGSVRVYSTTLDQLTTEADR